MKNKVSAFEYAISEAVGDTEFMKTHEPRTREEETEHRLNNIRNQAKKLRIADVRLSVCSVCGKKFGEVKKCFNVKCTNPFQTEA